MFRPLLLTAALAVSALPGPAVVAQDATLPAGTPVAGEVLDASRCTTAPRPPESVLALASPAADAPPTATPAAPEVPFGAFAGAPADPATATAYTALVREFWACNADPDFLRVLALVTDEELRQAFAPEDLVDIARPPEGTPEADEALGPTTLFAVLGVEVLADDRVGGYAVVDTPFDPRPVEVHYLVAAETAEGWRLDDIVCFDAAGGYCP